MTNAKEITTNGAYATEDLAKMGHPVRANPAASATRAFSCFAIAACAAGPLLARAAAGPLLARAAEDPPMVALRSSPHCTGDCEDEEDGLGEVKRGHARHGLWEAGESIGVACANTLCIFHLVHARNHRPAAHFSRPSLSCPCVSSLAGCHAT